MTTVKPRTCSRCGSASLLPSNDGLFCRQCWQLVDAPAEYSVSLPHATQSEKRAIDDIPVIDCEKALVREITRQLTARGWRVYHIGQLIARGSGTTAGVPDLLCVKPAQPPYPAIVRLLETKFGKNRPSAAQQELIDAGASVAVYTVREALAAVGEI